MPEETRQKNSPHTGAAVAVAEGNSGGAEGGATGVQGAGQAEAGGGSEENRGVGGAGGAAGAGGGTGPKPPVENGAESPSDDRPEEDGASDEQTRITARLVQRAMTEAGGDRKLAAEALGISGRDLAMRIRKNRQLKALWPSPVDVRGATAPEAIDAKVMNRRPQEMSPLTPESVELAQMVSESDNELLRRGLKDLGVSDKMITRLKTLDGLARSSGHFLSISLEKTHRLYFLQLIGLNEVADELRARLLAKPGENGFVESDENRSYLNRNYAEMVKEAGNGYKIMMEGATNMVRMLTAANAKDEPGGPTGKPKWGRVNEPKPAEPDDPTAPPPDA